MYGCYYFRGFVVHQHNVGSLNGCIRTERSHCYTYVGTRQCWCIVYAVAHESERAVILFLIEQLLENAEFVGWQQLRVAIVNANTACYILSYFLAIASQHDGIADAHSVQSGYSVGSIFLYPVCHNDMSGILTVNGYMHRGAHQMTLMPLCAHRIHHALVANAHRMAIHYGTYAVTGYLLYVLNLTSVSLITERLLQRNGYGVGAVSLHMGCKMKQMFWRNLVGMDGLNTKFAVSEGSSLVEHDGIEF